MEVGRHIIFVNRAQFLAQSISFPVGRIDCAFLSCKMALKSVLCCPHITVEIGYRSHIRFIPGGPKGRESFKFVVVQKLLMPQYKPGSEACARFIYDKLRSADGSMNFMAFRDSRHASNVVDGFN